MDTSSKMTRDSHTTKSKLEEFKLFYEFVPVQKNNGRIKRANSSRDK